MTGLTSSSSLELEEKAPSAEESAEDEVTGEAGEPPLDPPELSLLVSSQYGSRRLPPASNARTVRVSSPSKRQQRLSPSRRFSRRENALHPDPRKIKQELSTSNSTQEEDQAHPLRRSQRPLKLSSETMEADKDERGIRAAVQPRTRKRKS